MSDNCGCCTPNTPLTPVMIDNRPGLSAVAYRIGTYGSFRETMLDAIASMPELAGLTTRQDDDTTVTMVDLWSAALDVLTFYQERYANEVFLRTAQRPESLLRLARLLDYRARPGVAALADLAFTLDAGKTVQIPVGLRVQSVPGQNQQPQTFETLEAISADARFNRLRIFPKPTAVNPLQQGSTQAILDRLGGPAFLAALAANDPVVLFNDGGDDPPEEKSIAALKSADDMVTLSWSKPVIGSQWHAATKAFKRRRIFRLFGYNAPANFMQSTASDAVPGGVLWNLLETDFSTPNSNTISLDSRYSDITTGSQLMVVMPAAPLTKPSPFPFPGGSFGGSTLLSFMTPISFGSLVGSISLSERVQTFLVTITNVTQIGRSTPIKGGAAGAGALSDTVTQLTLDRSLPAISDIRHVRVFELLGDAIGFWGYAYGDAMTSPTAYLPGRFVETAGGLGIEVGRTIQQNAFVPGAVIRPDEFDLGRSVIAVDQQGQTKGSVQAPASFDPPFPTPNSFGHLVIPLDVASLSLATGSAALLGNVARASHGQTVLNEVLGSGDASARFQSFTLRKEPLTYVPSSGPGGVSSTLKLSVDKIQWSEVEELYGQSPTAQVFSTRSNDDGSTLVQGGGGPYGAAFPTGKANVTATYRIGSGVAGRVNANSLTTLLDRIQGLASVDNPSAADGGADPEGPDGIRQNAPRTVRTFDRAVSLLDFQDLITASGEVAKALATRVWDGFAPAVHLTVAGQGGGTFADLSAVAATLANARDPNQRLLIDNYVQVPVRVEAKLWIDPVRSQADVQSAATAALLAALSFDALELGEALHLSAIYAVLQAVPGVVAADVTRFGFRDGSIAYALARGATLLPDGTVAPVQDFLRIFSARPDASHPGRVVPAELAFIETPSQDVAITAQG